MPRYEPPAAETEPLLAPSTTPTRPQQTRTVSDQQPARYQHLNLESQTPITTPTYRQPRSSPLRCQGCFDLCIPSFSHFNLKLPTRAMITGYTAGIIFSIGWWVFIDGCIFNSVHYVEGGRMNYLSFEDWVPGLLSTLALIIVNMIDRESLNAEDDHYDGSNVAVKARACAFFGITVALGSLGGALAILSLKYIIPGLSGDEMYLVQIFKKGQAITVQNFMIFISSMILWFGRNTHDEGRLMI